MAFLLGAIATQHITVTFLCPFVPRICDKSTFGYVFPSQCTRPFLAVVFPFESHSSSFKKAVGLNLPTTVRIRTPHKTSAWVSALPVLRFHSGRARQMRGDDMCGAVLVILRANASVFVTQKEVARSCEHRPRHSFIFVPQRAPHSSRNLGHLEVSRPVVARCFLLICLFVPSYVAKKATRSGTPRTIVEERNSSP